MPIVASLDLHANVTHRMLREADALVSYRTYPHVDMADTGALAAELMARRLRADGVLGGVVLVALTGWGSSEDQRRTAEAGFDHHLTKPMGPGEIADILQRSTDLLRSRSSSAESN